MKTSPLLGDQTDMAGVLEMAENVGGVHVHRPNLLTEPNRGVPSHFGGLSLLPSIIYSSLPYFIFR